ncbi:hypothetical protein C4901_12360 [Acidiferrobacter sp. SPIII_3]|jgi:hypothetical protein|uniref:hypothetical protein n=1 Tax=Acidiferrobacter sp. SPIII_3 TaxID=1281578 RepID=UPI000D7349F3|nr:hypothetical protein [Acidiferrobacter sp. SPIII_3]AWP24020.1 hypothetical protein C4901_12360 [Acidiferrobacter sp. SPIII_3]
MRVPVQASTVAMLIALNLHRYGQERAKDITRIRLSSATLRKIAGKQRLREAFLEEIEDALFEIGFLFLRVDDGTFGVIAKASVSNWSRLSAKRINDLLGADPDTIQGKYDETLPPVVDEDGGDDE